MGLEAAEVGRERSADGVRDGSRDLPSNCKFLFRKNYIITNI